jgi:cyclophilin family peptidyl-prolyl cis-trans isomerase
MFKEENRIWLYMLGIIIMFGMLGLMTRDYMVPLFVTGEKTIRVEPVFETPPPLTIVTSIDYRAIVYTNHGAFTIDLYEGNATRNVNNFVFLSRESFYEGTKFHRLIPGMILQGGDPNTKDNDPDNDGKGGPGYYVDDEINLNTLNLSRDRIDDLLEDGINNDETISSVNMVKYSVAMASAGPDTNGSQFFIILADSQDPRVQAMNGNFTVIGQVIDGFATLNTIQSIPVDDATKNVPTPLSDIVINNIEIVTI